MKVTSKILHIPPYVSTTWPHVKAIYLKENNLVVSLDDGVIITVLGLTDEARATVFDAYAAFLEEQQSRNSISPTRPPQMQVFQINTPPGSSPHPLDNPKDSQSLSIGFESMESLASALQHNQSQANMPNLPNEILNKIAAVAKIVAPEDIENMPKPEPHCNCTHCQIARAIHGESDISISGILNQKSNPEDLIEEEITEQDLSFQQWEITQAGEKLFSVTNRLDTKEHYRVYLGEPVGCTCGNPGCEHILAVLKS